MTLSQDAIEKTTKLVEFLAEVTAAVERDPVCDILEDPDAPDPVIWLDALPRGEQWMASPADDVIMRLRPVSTTDGAGATGIAARVNRHGLRGRVRWSCAAPVGVCGSNGTSLVNPPAAERSPTCWIGRGDQGLQP